MKKIKFNNNGFIIIEILLAITISSFFMFLATDATFFSEKIFDIAYAKSESLDLFEAGVLQPKESSFGNFSKESYYEGIDLFKIKKAEAVYQSVDFCAPFIANNRGVGSYDYISSKERSIYQSVPNITPISFPIQTRNLITDIEVRNNIVYISTNSTTYSDHDIYIFDIQNRDSPLLLSSQNTGPGISALEVVNDKIYLAVASTQAQFQIIRINSLVSLDTAGSYSVPQPYATATKPFASSIDVAGDMLFLGTEKWEGKELFIYDISTLAETTPIYSFEVSSKVNDILFTKNKLYVSASAYDQLLLFENNDGWNHINSFSPRGWSRQEGSMVTVFENNLFFGRTAGGFDVKQDHEGFLWNHLDDGAVTDFDDFTSSINIEKGIYGAYVDKDFVYIATNNADKALTIFDKDLSTSTSMSFALPVGVKNMNCYNNRLYLVGDGVPVIYEIIFNNSNNK